MAVYTISVPAQKIDIEAPTKAEAVSKLMAQKMIKFDIGLKNTYKMPAADESANYYIDRLFENAQPDMWYYKSYIQSGDIMYFTDGHRIYGVHKDEVDNYYKDVTDIYPEKAEKIKEYMIPYKKDYYIVAPNKEGLVNKIVEANGKGIANPRYNYKCSKENTVHSINARYLLDAILFTKVKYINFGLSSIDRFIANGMLDSRNRRFAMVMPMDYTPKDLEAMTIDKEI